MDQEECRDKVPDVLFDKIYENNAAKKYMMTDLLRKHVPEHCSARAYQWY